MKLRRSSGSNRILAGMVAGLVAGLAASFAMNEAMRMAAVATETAEPFASRAAREKQTAARVRQFQELGDPNQEIITRASRQIFKRDFPHNLLQPTATAVHYVFGTALGAAYASAVEVYPVLSSGAGAAFALAWWGGVNELLLPRLGLLAPVKQIPRRAHVAMLASHLVYGVSLEGVRRSVRGLLRT